MKNVLVVMLAAFGILIFGCTKKKSQQFDQYQNVPQVSQQTDVKKSASDSIFDEFYTEDKQEKAVVTKAQPHKRASSYSGFADNGRYVVQVACVQSQVLAEKLRASLQQKGYAAYIAKVQNPTPELNGTYYRVRIEGFSTVSAAKEFGNNSLLPEGLSYWVDNKSNDNVGMEGYGLGTSSSRAYEVYERSSSGSSSYSGQATSSYKSTSSTSEFWGSSSTDNISNNASSATTGNIGSYESTSSSSGASTTPEVSSEPSTPKQNDDGWGDMGSEW